MPCGNGKEKSTCRNTSRSDGVIADRERERETVMAEQHKNHIGSSFDGFLEEEGTKAEVEAVALKRVIAWQKAQATEQRDLNKSTPKLL